MTILEEIIKANAEKYRNIILDAMNDKKEAPTMQVSYNGFTGELVKLERKPQPMFERYFYDLSIYDGEKRVTHSFTGVRLADVKFLGGAVAFGG